MSDVLPWVSLAISGAVLLVTLWVASRAGSWRNSDELRQLEASITSVKAEVGDVRGRVAVVENQVESEVAHLKQVAQRLESAVARMEGFFMRPPS